MRSMKATRSRPNVDERTSVSKTISAILRRDAVNHGLEIDEDGWVKLPALLGVRALNGIEESRLLTIVELSNAQKPRYELQTSDGVQMIRASCKRRPEMLRHEDLQMVTVRVTGLSGPLCEVALPRDSSVMDARKAISVAFGIPMQKQMLVSGLTKLADPSLNFLAGLPSEEAHITCVSSALDVADACTWCCNVLGVPVQSLCGCGNLYCVTCIRDMTGLNGQPAKCKNCPNCKRQLQRGRGRGADSVYVKRTDLIEILDEKYGKVECPRGCGESYFRCNARAHMDQCQGTRKVCRGCGQTVFGSIAEHEARCFVFGDDPLFVAFPELRALLR